MTAEKKHLIIKTENQKEAALWKYRNVYFIHPCATTDDHEFSVDGTHPDDYGYFLWEKSIEKPVLRILGKYGIR